MSLASESSIRDETLREVARRMLIAARTAPKGRGQDNTVLALLDGEEIRVIADKMKEIAGRDGIPIFERDADNLLASPVLVLLGTKIKPLGLKKCGLCGFANCAEKDTMPSVPCAFNTGDLGIAVGSAVSVAADNRVDNRVMYTVGQAVLELGLLGPEVRIVYGIPLSATAKSPYFDRKPV
jgi:uncharacterized ferredoxin-like protein